MPRLTFGLSRTRAPGPALSALAGTQVETQWIAVSGIAAPESDARGLDVDAELPFTAGNGVFHAENGRIVIEVECEASGLGQAAHLVLRLVYERRD